jgi:hypothetical protein
MRPDVRPQQEQGRLGVRGRERLTHLHRVHVEDAAEFGALGHDRADGRFTERWHEHAARAGAQHHRLAHGDGERDLVQGRVERHDPGQPQDALQAGGDARAPGDLVAAAAPHLQGQDARAVAPGVLQEAARGRRDVDREGCAGDRGQVLVAREAVGEGVHAPAAPAVQVDHDVAVLHQGGEDGGEPVGVRAAGLAGEDGVDVQVIEGGVADIGRGRERVGTGDDPQAAAQGGARVPQQAGDRQGAPGSLVTMLTREDRRPRPVGGPGARDVADADRQRPDGGVPREIVVAPADVVVQAVGHGGLLTMGPGGGRHPGLGSGR